ncbi:DUF3883 domain-containing protein [Enterococcus quebecensis]|uniref:Protein NO VEIN C-terminal domain-containing protein n=1 Tax=Enterococcus quebecensis TaxID=903983 RepID=A0A1E5GUY4_9ENTE|nr:DUF3883 domain-containing protein [Enterococcus quebecensis]OEG16514.1 hypothetical protein BCR23_06395 [Enterococcus quebecensis]OJG74112.1 hypothetical protein RV12_GL002750 [Enterococcus quebecensis]
MSILDELFKEMNIFNEKYYSEAEYVKQDQLREAFITDFPLESIKNIPLDKYVIGYNRSDSFCYKLEITLSGTGYIGAGYSDKFGIYWSKDDNTYKWAKKYGVTQEEVYEKVLEEISHLIEAGGNYDSNFIEKCLLPPTVRGKILSTYYPERYLNIFSNRHLDFFLTQLGSNSAKFNSVLEKQHFILLEKKKNVITEQWSIYKYSKFLYSFFGSPTNDSDKDDYQSEYNQNEMCEIETVQVELLDKNLLTSSGERERSNNNRNNGDVDFLEKNRQNTITGNRGEEIVLKYEKDRLKSNKNLQQQVERKSLKDHKLGYDILSFDNDGSKRYIEVKSTVQSFNSEGSLYISKNELEKARELANFWIYLVFDARSENPKLVCIPSPFTDKNEDRISLEPISFKAHYAFGEGV